MGWLRRARDRHSDDHSISPQLEATENVLSSLEQRADRVAADLTARRDRNHWGESVAELIWARSQMHPRRGR